MKVESLTIGEMPARLVAESGECRIAYLNAQTPHRHIAAHHNLPNDRLRDKGNRMKHTNPVIFAALVITAAATWLGVSTPSGAV
jgi:hypothetical protein